MGVGFLVETRVYFGNSGGGPFQRGGCRLEDMKAHHGIQERELH